MRIKKMLVSSVAVIAAGGVLVGCGGGDDDKNSSKDDSSQTDSNGDSDAGEDETEVNTGGSASVKVDGEDLEGFDAETVTCVKSNGSITVGSSDPTAGLAVMMTDEDSPKVTTVGIIVDGVSLAVASGSGAELGSAEVSVDGDTYTVTGTAQGSDAENPTELLEKDFEIVVSCD